MVKRSWMKILSNEENKISIEGDDSIDLQRNILEDLRKSNCSKHVDKKAMKQRINEDSKLECDNDVVLHVAYNSEETRNFEECPVR